MSRRGRNPNANPGVRPIQRIELNEKPSRKRYILIIVLVAIALVSFGVGLFNYLYTPGGWTQISPTSNTAYTCSDEMILYYELGASGRSANAENRAISTRYAELCYEAYVIFSADQAFDGELNLHHVNANAGEVVSVHPALYKALQKAAEQGGRWIFAAPYYTAYRNLFTAPEDAFAAEQDPTRDGEIAAYFAEIAAFVSDESHIRLEFLEDNRLRLAVSDAYRAFAAENGIEQYIDLYWAKNAFVVDYIADALRSDGFVYGYLASYDGFTRNLDTRDTEFGVNVSTLHEGRGYTALQYVYRGQTAMVSLRAFPLSDADERYYAYRDGEIRHAYVDVTDGVSRASADALVAYATDGKSCTDVLFSVLPLWISDAEITGADLAAFAETADGVELIVANGTRYTHTERDAALTILPYKGVTFTKEFINE